MNNMCNYHNYFFENGFLLVKSIILTMNLNVKL